jgi:hypothetical protein
LGSSFIWNAPIIEKPGEEKVARLATLLEIEEGLMMAVQEGW